MFNSTAFLSSLPLTTQTITSSPPSSLSKPPFLAGSVCPRGGPTVDQHAIQTVTLTLHSSAFPQKYLITITEDKHNATDVQARFEDPTCPTTMTPPTPIALLQR